MCRALRAAVSLHTGILDFLRLDGDDAPETCDLITLGRGGVRLTLSQEDGTVGTFVVVETPDIDLLFRRYRPRGLQTPGDPDAPTLVHEGPINQAPGVGRRRATRAGVAPA